MTAKERPGVDATRGRNRVVNLSANKARPPSRCGSVRRGRRMTSLRFSPLGRPLAAVGGFCFRPVVGLQGTHKPDGHAI